MALLRRQRIFESFDDQDPAVWGKYVGNWTHHTDPNYTRFANYTYTVTTTPGSSFSLTFSGSALWVYGGLLKDSDGFPSANYIVDGDSTYAEPYLDPTYGRAVYFESHSFTDRTHTLLITVTTANDTHPFVLDEITSYLSAGGNINATIASPSPTSTVPATAKPVGTIVGGVIGGIGVIGIIAILLVFVYRSPNRRTRNSQDGDVVNPRVAETLASEYRSEPFNLFDPPSSTGSSGPDPQLGYSEGSSSQLLNPPIGEAAINSHPQHTQSGPTNIASDTPQPVNPKAALRSQQYENVQQSAPSYETRSMYTEVPPSYGHH